MKTISVILWKDGLIGFYRGAFVAGAGTITQRAFVTSTFELLYTKWSNNESSTTTNPLIKWQAIAAGFMAGSLRAIIECPFEYLKVRRISDNKACITELYKGFSTLYPRSVILLTIYFTFVDFFRR